MISAIIADVAGLVLLLAGGTAGIWSALAVFWSEGLAAAITAAVRGGQRQSDLSDDQWLFEAHQAVDRLAARPLDTDESRAGRERDVARRRARLAMLVAIDRRTPEGAAAFGAARTTEDRLASGIAGVAIVAFPLIQGAFLLLLAVVVPMLGTAVGGLGARDAWAGFGGGELPGPVLPALDNPPLVLASMAAVMASGLWGLRRRAGIGEAADEVRRGVVRLFAMQAVLLVGGVLSIAIGWAGLAIGLTLGKLALDVLANRRRAPAR